MHEEPIVNTITNTVSISLKNKDIRQVAALNDVKKPNIFFILVDDLGIKDKRTHRNAAKDF